MSQTGHVMIRIAVLKERESGERRVAMVPAVIERLTRIECAVTIEAGAGAAMGIADDAFVGATMVDDVATLVADADIVLAVQPPNPETLAAMREGALLVCFTQTADMPAMSDRLAARQITCLAMERVPRISRAQAIDALSSQAALAGYYAPLLGATHLGRILPRMTTAAGSLRPAAVLVMGLGVAGLQAIATARRLGAVVEGYDVRPETRDEAASLGARFVETGVDARGEGGYARELTPEEKQTVAAAVTRHLQAADLVITTAAVPGRPAPELISAEQAAGMKAGAVIVDLAADSGGNCALSQPGETVHSGGITVIAPLNVPSRLAEHASELYARNILNLLELLIVDGELAPDWNDEVLAAMRLGPVDEPAGQRDNTAIA
ncbi:NAD(P) transhydrogenase subunit alpha [Salinisphaera hydrothermalis C41B8]|uniref:proton-translocating NAD(P)(+) transhydrogenase n=1 Tax=Salinisphaera hydrothermalis (strain C41B8) TaxID=1304275 RepID=A0A084IHW7_SALHC|nr:NAD(P) transhydrogenase subunit alpha [Salinisphaera hydrothermalis]KEZ76301.1 NAD(P) transhydrogenase subunit alpha [Salinisphaera hydrothermalis C41B8]